MAPMMTGRGTSEALCHRYPSKKWNIEKGMTMIETHENRDPEKKPPVVCEGQRIYYSKDLERRVFFILTLLMLISGICYKIGLF